VEQLGLKAGGIQLRRRQQRPLAQGAAFAQQLGQQSWWERFGWGWGGIPIDQFRVGCSLGASKESPAPGPFPWPSSGTADR
jgi:hypothetical protein